MDEKGARLLKDLAHELAGPLTPLSGYLHILQSGKLGALGPRERQILEAMHRSVTRLARIVENLSDFATLGPGEARLQAAPLDPDRLAEEVVEEQRDAIRDGHLHVNVLRSGAAAVVADGRKLRQALSNLVSNAVKFSPHGGEVLVEVAVDAGSLRFAVYDQGPGVAGDDVEGIFEPLHRAGRRAGDDTHAPGTGLGLPVARRIAEAHGGRAWVESPPRTQPAGAARAFGGSRFVLELPARVGPEPTGLVGPPVPR